jgi:hypothetical protein
MLLDAFRRTACGSAAKSSLADLENAPGISNAIRWNEKPDAPTELEMGLHPARVILLNRRWNSGRAEPRARQLRVMFTRKGHELDELHHTLSRFIRCRRTACGSAASASESAAAAGSAAKDRAAQCFLQCFRLLLSYRPPETARERASFEEGKARATSVSRHHLQRRRTPRLVSQRQKSMCLRRQRWHLPTSGT